MFYCNGSFVESWEVTRMFGNDILSGVVGYGNYDDYDDDASKNNSKGNTLHVGLHDSFRRQ